MCSLSKGQFILSWDIIQNAYLQNYAPFSTLKNFEIFLMSMITEDIYLQLKSMCSLSKGQSELSRETIQNGFLSEY